MHRLIACLIMVIWVLPAAAGSGTGTDSLTVGGVERTFRIKRPATAAPLGGHPAVLVFHGGQGDGSKIAEQTDFDRVAADAGPIVVYPDSTGYWNDGRPETARGVDDVAFVRRLVEHLVQQEGADPKRIYATGASNGGMFTLRLACEAADLIAAAAPVIASFPEQYVSRCRPSRPIPVLMINGTEDRLIQWEGGPILQGRNRGAGGRVIPVIDTFRFWERNNACSGERRERSLPDADPADGTRVTRIMADGCASGAAAELLRVDGGGHTWPGSPLVQTGLLARLVGRVSRDLDASREIWAFFSSRRLN